MGAQFKRVAISLLDFFCSCNPPECSQHSCKLNCGSFILPGSFSVIGISLIIILVQIFYTAELKGNRPTTFLLKTFTKASTRMADKKKTHKILCPCFHQDAISKSHWHSGDPKKQTQCGYHYIRCCTNAKHQHIMFKLIKEQKVPTKYPEKVISLMFQTFFFIIFSYFSASRTKRTQTLDRCSARLSSHYASSSLLYVRKCNGKYKTSQKWFWCTSFSAAVLVMP